jgi:hypothetical protein
MSCVSHMPVPVCWPACWILTGVFFTSLMQRTYLMAGKALGQQSSTQQVSLVGLTHSSSTQGTTHRRARLIQGLLRQSALTHSSWLGLHIWQQVAMPQ